MSSSDLPRGWVFASLDDVSSSLGGSTPSKSDSTFWIGGDIPWVSPKDMKAFHIRSSEDTVTKKALARLTKIPENSVLMVVRSGILARTLPVAVNMVPVTINQDMRAFVPEDGMDPRFLALQLIGDEREILGDCSKDGTTVASIEGPALSAYPLKIAPTFEQQRIVEKLEQLLSDLDAGVADLKAAQRKLAQSRQSLLKAAVEGALTADWRAAHGKPQETGAELLQRILSERRARWEQKQLAKLAERGKAPLNGWQAKYPEPTAPNVSDLPALPASWTWASVDQLSPDDLANGRSVPTAETGAKVLRLTAVRSGKIDLSEWKHGAWSEEDAKPFAVAEGDLLIVRGNGSLALVGRAGLVGSIQDQVAYPDTLIRLRAIETLVRPAWISLVWDSDLSRNHLEERARTSAGIYKISQPDIISVRVPVPSLAEQDLILTKFDSYLEQLGLVDTVLKVALRQSTIQRKNLLKAAFSGQLTPQDQNDEPASELLARIRAARAGEGATTRKRGRKAKEKA